MALSQQELLAAAAKGGYDDEDDTKPGDRGDVVVENEETGEAPSKEEPPEVTDSPGGGEQAEEGEQAEGGEQPPKDDKNVELRVKKALSQRDEARRQLQEMQERLEALEGKTAKVDSRQAEVDALNSEIDALYEQVEEARAIADVKLAAQLQRQLDAKRTQLVKAETVAETTRVTEARNADKVHDQMLDMLEANYTVLDSKSDEYDPALAREIQFNTDAFIKAGMSPPAALRRSTTLVFGFDPFAPQKPGKTEPAKPAAKPTDVKKAMDVSARTPPAPGVRGKNVDVVAINPAQLSDEEFAALPESKKRALRGDF